VLPSALAVTSSDRVVEARLGAIVIALFSFLPYVNWIAGGHEASWYAVSLSEWVNGSLISLGSALVLFLVVRRIDWWPSGWATLSAAADRRPWVASAIISAVALALYATIAIVFLSGRPLQIDEIVQVMQARIFSEGGISRPADAFPEFFSALNVVDMDGKVYSQFPPGGPLMMVPGVMAGVTWLTGPVFGSVAVVAFWQLVRRTEASPSIALGATMLLAFAPFMAFMAGSHMNHVPTLAWLCLGMLGLRAITSRADAGVLPGFLTGLCLGVVVSIRPVDGAAFALPAGLWLLARTFQRKTSLACLLGSGVGVALPLAGVLAFNSATTGSATLFGYELLWGASHGLGFHQAPWGIRHTPMRGLELVNLYFLRLQNYLFETPLPSLVPAMAGLALARRVSAFDRYLLAGSALLVGGYFAYWHDGFFLGPRFVYLLLPALVLWTARLPSIARNRFPSVRLDRFVLLVYAVSALVAVLVSLPVRARQYARGVLLTRLDYLEPATTAGVTNALIFVRESWGSQLIARLYGLGVPRSEADALYRTVDSCLLDGAITGLELSGVRGAPALDRLRPLSRESVQVRSSTRSPAHTERLVPGATYSWTCQRRILEDRGGYAFFAPLLARDPGTNIYARDLHARDTVLVQRYGNRPLYLLRAESSEVGSRLMLERISMDSARAEWASSTSGR
jgi:hypothetical protein